MYWHIDTDIVSLIVILAIYVYTVVFLPSDRHAANNRSFTRCMQAGIVMTIIDIVASIIMEVPTTPFWYHLFLTAYLLTIELSIVAWFRYCLTILYQDDEKRQRHAIRFVTVPYLLYAALVLTNPWTGLFFTLGPNMAYSRGPIFLPAMVGLYIVYALALFALIVIRRKRVPKGYPISVLLLVPTLLTIAIPLQLLNDGWLMILPAYMLCLVLAFLFFQNLRVRSERAMLKQLTDMVENFSSGLALCRVTKERKLEVQYLSKGLADICEEDAASLKRRYQDDMVANVYLPDRDMVSAKLREAVETFKDHEITYRVLTPTGKLKWLNVKSRIVPEPDGSATVYATYTDMTEQRESQQRLADVIQNVPGGICLYQWDGKSLAPLIANARLSEMLGEDAQSYLSQVNQFEYTHVHPEDRRRLKQETVIALTETHALDITYRTLNLKTNEYLWIRLRGKMLPQPDGSQLVFCGYNDVTQEHHTETQLRQSEQMLEYAAEQAGLMYWRYDAKNDIVYPGENGKQNMGLPPVMEHFTRDWLDRIHILPEYDDVYRDACQRIKNGEKQVVFEAQNRQADGSTHWLRYCLTNLFDANGKPTIAVGTTVSIDTEKELWAKYDLERKRAGMDEENLVAHAIFNLSTEQTLEYVYQDGHEVPVDERTAFDYGRQNIHLLIDAEEREQFLAFNSKEWLLERFAMGESEHRLEFRKQMPDGNVIWVRSSTHLVRDPRNGDVLLFEYWYDIEEEKMLELMYHSLASDNYDYVARINGKTRRFVAFPKPGLSYHVPPQSGDDADAVAREISRDCVLEDDLAFVTENTQVERIKDNLRHTDRYQFTYRERQPDGSVRHKKLTQYYIDRQREIIVMTREDVTDILKAEADKNAILANALEVANQASEAKSQFLSRVSHELRTPLNAIIGFMDLARDADEKTMEAYLNNSDIAAKQLLSIINDVLDVSAIEAGKMKIAHAPFDFKRLIHSITNVYVSQCVQKGLSYETRIVTPIDEWLVGDQLRVNQILLNLLGNAVKFTSEGHVWLSVSQRVAQNDKVFVRFEVSDTGCGISAELRERLFKPFEQESASTAQRYGGSGLGLSIVGNLVSMMNGRINVESRVGEGSIFTVDLPFVKSDVRSGAKSLENAGDLHVLAVDDEAREREYTSAVLQRLGVRHTCVGSGSKTMEELENAEKNGDAYNLCLVDWKMPDVSGLEITRRIREQYGQHLIVIVVSAYEHYQAEESAKASGADMFITKPLFQSSLMDLFSTLTKGQIAQKEADAPTRQYFAGKRVLLAEDNKMNRLVAEGLIKKKFGLECDDASDGQIALDMFLSSPKGYYDAILMDIQMPNLDGYGATAKIRASAHPDAKTVPIIALTANAFSEDIAKSLSSGMNAHVSKPIDPQQLGRALEHAFESNQA